MLMNGKLNAMSNTQEGGIGGMSDVPEASTSQHSRPRRRHLQTGRLQSFSDGVFAIAVTLLVLNLAVPAGLGSTRNLLGAFGGQWPSYLAYVVSFATIGAVWIGHSLITEYLEHADGTLIRLNLLLLLVVSFLPFPTRLLAEYISADNAERVAATIYGLTLLCTVGLLSLLWRYALHAHLVRPDADDTELTILTERLTPGLAGYGVLLILGLVAPVIAVIGYFLLAIYYIIPFSGLTRRKIARRRPGA
jgi:uncharacterized membrane protein